MLSIPLTLMAKSLSRFLIQRKTGKILNRLFSDDYPENLMELYTASKRISLLNILEIGLRAEKGQVITRPLGSPKQFPGYDTLMFAPSIMTRKQLAANAPIDMHVKIGPNAQKPLLINIPLMISAMAYGIALSEKAKIALARAAQQLGTVTNSGEGPVLPEEQKEAAKYVLQISRWPWGLRSDEQIAQADMLEVQMAQGADLGSTTIDPREFKGRARKLMGLPRNQPAEIYWAPLGVNYLDDWPKFMDTLRKRANGIPIALKIMATGRLEEDLAVAVNLGFDVIVIGGAQGGSHASPTIKQDDFGIPSINALVRASNFLRSKGVRDKVSLIVAGGYFTPGECLKALALGADAIYLATVPLLALTHKQLPKVMPWEPPTQLVYYHSKNKAKLNVNLAVKSVVNTLQSMVIEMTEAMHALGKSSLKELSPDDLVALDDWTAEITGVRRI